MRHDDRLSVPELIGGAYRLLWRHRGLHAKAIWAPIVFLVTAEFLYHRVIGNADGLSAMWRAVARAPWWMPLVAAFAWLAGLKFLLSFSISWRRHLLQGERFDSLFFGKPFWRYLALLIGTYVWLLPLVFVASVPVAALAAAGGFHGAARAVLIVPVLALAVGLWAIVRQVPFFTALTLDKPHPGWRDSVGAMRGQAWRYALAWVVAMLPVFGLNLVLDTTLQRLGADRHAVGVALGESAFRQAMLFIHFSLGASIGAFTFSTLFRAPARALAPVG